MLPTTRVRSSGTLTGRCMAARPCVRSSMLLRDRAPEETPIGITTSGSRQISCSSSETAAGLKDAAAPLTDRVVAIHDKLDLDAALDKAGDRLVVLELMSSTECSTGLFEVSEDQWSTPKEQYEKHMKECMAIRSDFVELAATSLSARFYCVVDDPEDPSDIAPALGINTFPSVVFFKNRKVVWQRQGWQGMAGDLAEGVLALGGKQYVTSASVAEITSESGFDVFVKARAPKEQHLKIIMMSSYMCSPCVHAYPYFVALSASFTDFEFARLEGDDEAMGPIFERLNILEVPTLLVYNKDGEEVSRLVSGDPGDLVGFIIELSAKLGFSLPSKK